MSALNRIAHFQGRRDEAPNQALAKDLASRKDRRGIGEIAEGLSHEHAQVRSDCIKVLYEIGATHPDLVAGYAPEFFRLLGSKKNREVWGAMTAIASIAGVRPQLMLAHRTEILRAMKAGSVITIDNGVLALARSAATSPARRRVLLPLLFQHLETCRPKDVPQHAEKALPAVDRPNRAKFLRILERRMGGLTPSQKSRVGKVIRQAENL